MKNFLFQLKKVYGQIFLYPQTKIDKKNGDYDAYWKEKRGENIGIISRWQKQRADIILNYLNKDSPITLVDIGCGDGSVLKYIKAHVNISKTTGVDVSDFALEKAKEFGVETIKADIKNIKNLDIIPESDYILLFEVLEHIPDSELFLKHMFRKAKKGVFFSFPNTGFYTHRLRLLFGKFPLQWRVHPGEHVRFWTMKDLQWWLNALGYKNHEIISYEGIPGLNRIWPSLFAAGFLVYIKM